jgi:hypothetical protein
MIDVPPPALYKYVTADRIDVLDGLHVRFTQASALNDPFELMVKISGLVPDNDYEKHLTPTDHHMREALRRRYAELPRHSRRRMSEAEFLHAATSDPKLVKAAQKRALDESSPYLDRLIPQLRESLRNYLRHQIGIFSLSDSAVSVTQWAYYAANGTGLVYEYDTKHPWFDRRRSPRDECFHLRKVRYANESPKALSELSSEMLVTKGVQWQHEQEWRVLAPVSGASKSFDADADRVHLFSIPATTLSGVVLGYAVAPSVRDRVVRLIRTRADLMHVAVRVAELLPDSHEVIVKPI